MRSLDRGQDKIQKICDKLRRETLEPAEEEALDILNAAKEKAESIKEEAARHADQLIKQAKSQIEQERNVYHTSLQQASKQAMEGLRQEIEHKLFNEGLQHLIEKQCADPKVIAELINGIVQALDKEGLGADFSVIIPQKVSPEEVNSLLLDDIRKRLQGKAIEIGHFAAGVQVKLLGKKLTVDLSDQAIRELLATYMRKDFRKFLFG